MASEIAFRIDSTVNWDGVTPSGLQRKDFTIHGQRYYVSSIEAPAGRIGADFFGVFSSLTPKLVGIASSSSNPMSVARVVSTDDPDVFREQVSLSPQLSHVSMFPGDHLAIVTHEDGICSLEFVVTEFSDQEHIELALRSKPPATGRRIRIIRTGGTGFNHQPTANTWQPALKWDTSRRVLAAYEVVNGIIPARDLCMSPGAEGCYLSVRYSGLAGGEAQLFVLDGHLREPFQVEGKLKSGVWSKVAFVGRDDFVGLSSAGPDGDSKAVVCDIELVLVAPGKRLIERYARGS